MKVYVLRGDDFDSQHPVGVYTSIEVAMKDNPGEWTELDHGMLLIKKPKSSDDPFRVKFYVLEEFEVKE